MKRSRKKNILLILTLIFWSAEISAQVEFNVKLKENESELITYFHQLKGPVNHLSIQNQRNGLSFISNIRNISPLSVNPDKNVPRSIQSVFCLRFEGISSAQIKEQLLNSGIFEFVEENRSIKILSLLQPNDPQISDQWYHRYIQTFEAWSVTRGVSTVIMGVLDTGLDYDHPEFIGQVAVNVPEDINANGTFEGWPDSIIVNGISGDLDGIDNDDNGYTDDVIGFDFTDQPRSPFGGDYLGEDGDPMDENNHGTLVAGIIAAKADNNFGGSGIAPGCKLKVLRAFSASGVGEDDDISRAIVYAADNGVPILNFSFGDIYPSNMMHEAIKYAYSKGVVMIGSAGNGTGDNVHYPSAYNEVIAVSASTVSSDSIHEYIWPLSSYGPTLSLCAPGSEIYAPVIHDSSSASPFNFFSGTSTSAPMVTASVGLLFSQRGALSPQQVRGLLVTSADDIGDEGWDHYTGAGRLNIKSMLETIAASDVQILSPMNDQSASAGIISITGTVFDPELLSYSLSYHYGIDASESWTNIIANQSSQVMNDTLADWDISTLAEGEYILRLSVLRSDGTTNEDRIRFLIDRTAPTVTTKLVAEAWDNQERKMMIVFRSDDPGTTKLHYRPLGGSNYNELAYDRTTHNGDFLLGMNQLSDGDYEFYVSTTNAGDLTGNSPLDTFSFALNFISQSGFYPTGLTIPMGYYTDSVYDFDGDGLKEVLMSEYTNQLSFGRLKLLEYSAGFFAPMDSLSFKPVLIPKDVADTDGDGLEELLFSVNDSVYIAEQQTTGVFPKQIIYSNLGNRFYASNFANTDADPQIEMLLKDFQDYFVFDGAGNSWTQSALLPDNSGNYQGSLAPRTLTGDFDNDGNNEIVFGDYDGDFIIYENQSGNYIKIFQDTTALEKSGSFLVQGDFDNDGIDEIFVAVHSGTLRNNDFEYDSPYWLLRIFKSTGDNAFSIVWQDYLYDMDTEEYNAASSGNVDTEPGDEIVFTTFPRSYIIDHNGSNYEMSWFHYGDLCTHHIIADFNGDGVNEFALGRGDSAFFYEKDFNYAGPQATTNLSGWVNDSVSATLKWQASLNATSYRIWFGIYDPNGTMIAKLDSTNSTQFIVNGLTAGTDYLFVIDCKNTLLNPNYSDYSNLVVLRPHPICKVDSVKAISSGQAIVYFSQPVTGRSDDLNRFVFNSAESPISISGTGDNGKRLLLSIEHSFINGVNALVIDSSFRDAFNGPILNSSLAQNFTWSPDTGRYSFLTHWNSVNEKQAALWFNLSMDSTALDINHYAMDPYGDVIAVDWTDASHSGVNVTVDQVAFGALGYPLTITITQVSSIEGAPITTGEGNAATFSEHLDNLSSVYVYPNPVKGNNLFTGIRFANLTRHATIKVISVSGREVIELTEADGDGGLEWNLNDFEGKRIKPGVYIYKVSAEGEDDFLGKFTVLE